MTSSYSLLLNLFVLFWSTNSIQFSPVEHAKYEYIDEIIYRSEEREKIKGTKRNEKFRKGHKH